MLLNLKLSASDVRMNFVILLITDNGYDIINTEIIGHQRKQ